MIFPADDIGGEEPKPTALFAATASAASANSWTSVNGWSVPRVYSSVAEEYDAARTRAVAADFGALVRYTVRGEEAAAFLARVTTAPVANLEPGESARGLMLDASGAVADIIEAARLTNELYLLTCSRRHARRMQLAGRGIEAAVEDITGRVAALAIIGPEAREVAAAAGVDPTSETLAIQTRVRGVEASARPIHHGALPGVEIIYPYDEALTLWERLRRASAPKPVGLDALEILRIEGGTPRPGADFAPAEEARGEKNRRRPSELGLPHLAPVGRAWFNGRRALRDGLADQRWLAVIAIDADACAPGAAVFSGKNSVGRITTCAFSPRLKRVVAFADVAAGTSRKGLEVALFGEGGQRAAAEPLETPEGRLAAAFRATEGAATESGAPAV
ncbi:MAG: glycine cleavage T C-terminal barrel domain-containing protein [Parvularculaceae bacterium]